MTPASVLINDEIEAIDLEDALNEVSEERRAWALRYRNDLDRRLSVAVYLLLKEVLKNDYGLKGKPRLACDARGKPFLIDHPDIYFNFSHCPKAAACIVAKRPVGIDVEVIAPVNWAVARRVLSETEFAEVRESAEPDIAFACYWTRKEAWLKMKGVGISESSLPGLLGQATDCQLQTTINRERGYVLTTATQKNDIM